MSTPLDGQNLVATRLLRVAWHTRVSLVAIGNLFDPSIPAILLGPLDNGRYFGPFARMHLVSPVVISEILVSLRVGPAPPT